MFCAVAGPPLILRLYGRAAHPRGGEEYASLLPSIRRHGATRGAPVMRLDFDP